MIELRPGEPGYPKRLLDLRDPPDPLWVSGELPAPEIRTVAVVGTRRNTPYGKRIAGEIAGGLAAAGAIIVSGLAQGIDSIAHASALDAGGRTIAVLGEGLSSFQVGGPLKRRRLADRIRQHGALVSEYALDLPAQHWTFPRRNATIAALADAVVIVEAPAGSGALITADRARELARPVYVVPGPVGATTWAGSNAYVADGHARLLAGPATLARSLGLEIPLAPPDMRPQPHGARLLELLAGGAADADAIARKLELSTSSTTSLIAELLLAGAIAPTGDGRFTRVR